MVLTAGQTGCRRRTRRLHRRHEFVTVRRLFTDVWRISVHRGSEGNNLSRQKRSQFTVQPYNFKRNLSSFQPRQYSRPRPLFQSCGTSLLRLQQTMHNVKVKKTCIHNMYDRMSLSCYLPNQSLSLAYCMRLRRPLQLFSMMPITRYLADVVKCLDEKIDRLVIQLRRYCINVGVSHRSTFGATHGA